MKLNESTDDLLTFMISDLAHAMSIIDYKQQHGYTQTFIVSDSGWKCLETGRCYRASEIRVDEMYRFEDERGVLNGLFIFAITQPDDRSKGLVIVDTKIGECRPIFSC